MDWWCTNVYNNGLINILSTARDVHMYNTRSDVTGSGSVQFESVLSFGVRSWHRIEGLRACGIEVGLVRYITRGKIKYFFLMFTNT